MNADWLIGVERWRKSLPVPMRAVTNALMGFAMLGFCIAGWYLLVLLIFSSANPAIGLLWFAVVVIALLAFAQYHDRKRRRR